MLSNLPPSYFILAVLLWLVSLTFLVLHARRLLSRLSPQNQKEAEKYLKDLSQLTSRLEKNQESLEKKLTDLSQKTQTHLQKVGLVRFNPFSDTGGNQSFALSLLDSQNNGIVIVSLHSREGSHFYTKTIKDGKSLDHPLSKEESQSIVNAR